MAYSLGLTLYNLANRHEPHLDEPRPARPSRRLIWLHVPSAERASPILELARRLVTEDGYAVLITCKDRLALQDGMLQDRPPRENPADARAFLQHWTPDLGIFADGELRPALLQEAANLSLPVFIVQGRKPYLPQDLDGWYPGLSRSVLHRIPHILVLDETAARNFRKAGAAPGTLEIVGRMEAQSTILHHTEAERASLAELLTARPIWLVAGFEAAEQDAILLAHRRALRLAHRLLLIVVTQDSDQAMALARKMEADHGWNVALRGLDQEPEPEVEVLITDSPAEMGLWYRLAPVTFLGGSLLGNGCVRNPMEGAAHGSSLIAGGRAGEYGPEFGRLVAAHAMRVIGFADELPDALAELLAPDRAARLANSAWGVVSDGAEVTDHVIALIHRIADGEV